MPGAFSGHLHSYHIMKIILPLFALIAFSCQTPHQTPAEKVKAYYIDNLNQLKKQTTLLAEMAGEKKFLELRYTFNEARKYYKRTEALTEFYFPAVAKAINGPAIDKLEEDDEKVIAATGFQVIEELIFPETDSLAGEDLAEECRILNSTITRLQQIAENTTLTDQNIIEAIRLQLLRTMSLGLSGFDSPINQNSVTEAMATLDGIEFMLLAYSPLLNDETKPASARLITEMYFCRKDLMRAEKFDTFDRAYFISRFFNPLCHAVQDFQSALKIGNNPWPAAIDLTKPDFFQEGVFNTTYFAPPGNRSDSEPIRELGKMLFFDPMLSGNNSRSCASCHKPDKAFSDNSKKSPAFANHGNILRNTPVLVNSAFQMSQFWDGRVTYIEDQVDQVISSPEEMHGDLEAAAASLGESEEYQKLFSAAFPDEKQTKVSGQTIRKALATYVRSLQSFNSRFDRYMRGDFEVLTESEIKGFNLFMGKAKCGTCHFLPLFNGSVPPLFKETEAEILGVPASAAKSNPIIDSDKGKYHKFPHYLLENMFKTPTVRNAALTAPYMHNGVFQTLEEVIDFYEEGGGNGLNLRLQNQTLPPDKLNLTASEKSAVIDFIHALTDTTGLTSRPRRLPAMKNSKLTARKVGGLY